MTEPKTGSPAKLIRLETFDTAIAIDPADKDAAKRRFMTLLLDPCGISRGNNGCVARVRNTAGETFAMKVLTSCKLIEERPAKDTRSPEETSRRLAGSAALFEEYRNLCAVSHLQWFPHVYGYGTSQGEPLILMEWVKGVSLADAAQDLPHDASGNVCGRSVAAIGRTVSRALIGAQSLSAPIVHRDLSPANIILRTVDRTVAEQVAALDFDLCLIDMGSSVTRAPEGALTMRADIWRFATPAYAAPEMLTQDVPGIMAKRRDPAVDVYALCSLLYELYAGHLPYDISTVDSAAGGSYYLLKTQQEPRDLQPRESADRPLVDIIMQGLAVEPGERPSARQIFAATSALPPAAEGPVAAADDEPADAAAGITTVEGAADEAHGTHLTVDIAAERVAATLVEERQRLVTRRKFIGAGIGAAALALAGIGLATRGFGIPDYLNGVRSDLGSYTWQELQELSDKIKTATSDDEAKQIAMTYHLLDREGRIPYPSVKTVELADGRTVGAQLLGLRHDTLADEAGSAGLSFIFDRGIARRDAADAPITGGWKDCGLRTWLDTEGMQLLPQELQVIIKPVMKTSNNVGAATDASALTALRASLWLPAMVELVGVQPPTSFSKGFHYLAALYNGEGTEYQLFHELKTTPYGANETLVRPWKGGSAYWWQRTVSPDVSQAEGTLHLNRVGRDGDAFMYATPADSPDKPTCVIPGFCI